MCADVGEALTQMFAQAMCEHESQNVVQCGDFMLSIALLACSPIQSLKMVQRQISLRKATSPRPKTAFSVADRLETQGYRTYRWTCFGRLQMLV